MNKKGLEPIIWHTLEILLAIIFLIVIIYLISQWRDQGNLALGRLFGIFQ